MPSRRLAVLPVLLITFGLGLSACGGDDTSTKPKPSPSKIVVTGPGSTPSVNFDTGLQFAQALAGNTASTLATARSLAAPKSAALRYVTRAQAKAGSGALTLKDLGESTYRLCPTTGACTKINQLVLVDGKVSTFKVNGKQLR